MVLSVNFKSNTELAPIEQREKVSGGATGLVAFIASQAVTSASAPITIATILPAMKKAGEMDSVTISKIHKGAYDAWRESGLKEKGVKVKFYKRLADSKVTLLDLMNPIKSVEKGVNAFFTPQDLKNRLGGVVIEKNSILMPEKDISYALYHELGHAHNYNMSKVGKALIQCRPVSMYLPALIAIYGAFSRKSKSYNGEELSGAQKTNNFIRDNAGKISLIATLPMLIEEAMATKKGLGWAKKYLSPENFKQVKKGNLIAYTSYLLTAGIMALSAWAAVKVKDKLIAKREQEQEELYKLAMNS